MKPFVMENSSIKILTLRQFFQKSADDISNFDKEFTDAEPALTPVGSSITNQLDHNLFDGFR